MPFATFTTEFELLTCYECGMEYAVRSTITDQRLRDGEPFRCPNGHENTYVRREEKQKREETAAELERRRELVAAVHRAEQAEARASEAEAKLTGRPRPEPDTSEGVAAAPAAEPEALPDSPNIKIVDGRMICPHCGKGYQNGRSFAYHLTRKHEDRESASAVSRRVMPRRARP